MTTPHDDPDRIADAATTPGAPPPQQTARPRDSNPLPPLGGRRKRDKQEAFPGFGADYAALNDLKSGHIVEAILKHPAHITHTLMSSEAKRVRLILLAVIIVCMLGHGIAMGSFSGGNQFWFVPLKLVAGLLTSVLICLPSLYILSSLYGGKQTLPEIWGLVLQSLALASILMVGFTPIVWLFSQSTEAVAFMGFLHLVFWIVAAFFAFRVLASAFSHLNGRPHPTLRLWAVIFMAVTLQMTTALRPLIGDYKILQIDKKQFFVAHWVDALKGRR